MLLGRVGIAVVAALLPAPPALAARTASPQVSGIPTLDHTATASLSDAAVGAKAVELTLRVHAELQCGRLASTTIIVSLPAAMRVPSTLARRSVLVSGRPASSVRRSASRVLIRPGQSQGAATCDVLGPGVARITFTHGAGLGNPLHAGSYSFTVVATPRGGEWRGTIAIR